MQYVACIAPLLLPILFWAAYHYYKDRHLPEPLGNLFLAFLLGTVSIYLAKLMYSAIDLIGLRYDASQLAKSSYLGVFAYAIFAIGSIEELAKLIPFWLVVLRFRAFDEPIDGIIYASFIALGFAAVENVQYFPFLTTAENIARGLAGPLVHIMFASIWGYYIGMAFLEKTSLLSTTVVAIAITAFLHGVYDFVVLALPGPALPVAALLILAIWLWRMRLIRSLQVRAISENIF